MNLPAELYQRMITHAINTAPNECCGVLAMYQGAPTEVYAGVNIASDPEHMFEMSPASQLKIFNSMSVAMLDLGAIYHSHPLTPPIPSTRDLKMAFYPTAFHFIIGLGELAPDIRLWHYKGSTYEPISLTILPRRGG